MSKEQPQSIVEIPRFYETQSGLIVANYAASLALATEGYIDPETGFLAKNPAEVASNVMDVMIDTNHQVGQNTSLALELFQDLAGANDKEVLRTAMGESLYRGTTSIQSYASSPEAASAARVALDSKVRHTASRESLYRGTSSIQGFASPQGRKALRADFDATVLRTAMRESLYRGTTSIQSYASSPEAASAMRLKFNDKVTDEINRSSSARKALTTIDNFGFGEEFISKSRKAVAEKWLEPTRQELAAVQAELVEAKVNLQKLREAGLFQRLLNRRNIRDLKTSVLISTMRSEELSGVIIELEASTTAKTKRSRSTANLRLVPNPKD